MRCLHRNLADTILCLAAFLSLTLVVDGQQTVGSFQCSFNTVAIDRMHGSRFVPIQSPSPSDSPKILTTDFSGFDPQYALNSVHFEVVFVPDQDNRELHIGKLRILARLWSGTHEQWLELVDSDTKQSVDPEKPWFSYGSLSDRLRVRFEPLSPDDEPAASDDPSVERWARPQVRIHQAAPKIPVFLMKYVSLTRAGGRGDVDTEQAIVLDMRGADLMATASVGCVKNDFAGENHEDEWIECLWNPRYADYVCRTNSYYGHDWDFLLIEGRKLPPKRRSAKH